MVDGNHQSHTLFCVFKPHICLLKNIRTYIIIIIFSSRTMSLIKDKQFYYLNTDVQPGQVLSTEDGSTLAIW